MESFRYKYAIAFPSKPNALRGFLPYFTATNLATHPVTVQITFDIDEFSLTSVIAESEEETFELPSSVFLPNNNGITSKTILVCSSGEISLYGFVSKSKEYATMFSVDQFMDLDPWDKYIGGAYLALPANDLGTEHYIVAYPKQQDFTTVFTVSALENNTEVNITFTAKSTPRSPRKFSLQFGESYQVLVTSDTTSSMVVSDKPVSVIAASKSEANNIFLLKQIPPKQSFGTEFVLTPFEGGSYDFCVVAPDSTAINTCQVSEGSYGATSPNVCEEEQVKGFVCVEDFAMDIYTKITSKNPITVVQYMKGYASSTDSVCLAMLIVPPVQSYIGEVEFSIIGEGNVFMNIFILSKVDTAFEINGKTEDMTLSFKAEIEGIFVYRKEILTAGRHAISSSTSGAKFAVIVHGGMHSDTGGETTTTIPAGRLVVEPLEGSGATGLNAKPLEGSGGDFVEGSGGDYVEGSGGNSVEGSGGDSVEGSGGNSVQESGGNSVEGSGGGDLVGLSAPESIRYDNFFAYSAGRERSTNGKSFKVTVCYYYCQNLSFLFLFLVKSKFLIPDDANVYLLSIQ